jgi:hypothetical protein
MREETRRRLDRAIWRDRLRWAGVGVAIVFALCAAFAYTTWDARTVDRRVAGTIFDVETLNSKNASQGLNVGVKLEDGRQIQVIMLRSREPHVGDPVEVVEHTHGTGRLTFTYK